MAFLQTGLWAIVPTLVFLVLVHLAFYLLREFVILPRRIKWALEKQGVRGPPPRSIMGNVPERKKMAEEAQQTDMEIGDYDILPRIMPFHCAWTQQYGRQYLWWLGPEPVFTITDPEVFKEILLNKNGIATKNHRQLRGLRIMLGKGLVSTIGEEWSLHRRIVNPAFHHDRLKHMIGAMMESTRSLLESLEKAVVLGGGSVDVEMQSHMRDVTMDIISRTAFGSSYKNGKKVFEEQRKLVELLVGNNPFFSLPGLRGLPTPANLKIARQQKKLNQTLTEIIQARKDQIKNGQSESYGHDLLGLMILAADEDYSSSLKSSGIMATFDMKSLIAECRTFYFAGHETTTQLLTWTLMLLSTHTEWQDRARAEVVEVCGDLPLDADAISKLKILTMILNESSRLFPPVPAISRSIARDVKLGGLDLPKGCGVVLPIVVLQHDPSLWGDDCMKFKPERFAQGIANAGNHQLALMPFSFGPRICVGHVFAMQEAKVVMATLLRQLRFRLSPQYRHAPTMALGSLQPQHGMPLVVEKVNSKKVIN